MSDFFILYMPIVADMFEKKSSNIILKTTCQITLFFDFYGGFCSFHFDFFSSVSGFFE